jgi:hypothetical protein
VYLHGFYVQPDRLFLFNSDPTRARQQVLNSGKDVVLIAPFLGYMDKNKAGAWVGAYDWKDLGAAGWGERYLNQVLLLLARTRKPGATTPLGVKNLVIAAHSGGGKSMRNLVDTLGAYRPLLRECWGLDCLYHTKNKDDMRDDDSVFWLQKLLDDNDFILRVYFGPSTIDQSVKLFLMGRGLATSEGKSAFLPAVDRNLRVVIGAEKTVSATGAVVNNAIRAAYDDAEWERMLALAPRSSTFVGKVASVVEQNHKFQFGAHYIIARLGFLFALGETAAF